MTELLNNRPYQAVLFDLDGTLIDTAIDMIQALVQLANKHGIEHQLNVAEYRQYISRGAVALVQSVFDNPSPAELEVLRVEYLEIYQQLLNSNNQLFAGIEPLIQHLNTHAVPWGIVTNKPSWLARPIVSQTPELNRSQVLICADEVGQSKPHPKPLLLAADKMSLTPEHTLYLGDAESDILAARAAGMVSGVALWGYLAAADQPEQWQAHYLFEEPAQINDQFS